MTDLLCIYMPCHHFHMFPTVCALFQTRTWCVMSSTALKFFIFFPVLLYNIPKHGFPDTDNNHDTHIFRKSLSWLSAFPPSFINSCAIAGARYPAFAITISGLYYLSLSYNALKVRLSFSFPGCTLYHRTYLCLSQAVSIAYTKTYFFWNHPLSGSLTLHFFTPSGISSSGVPALPPSDFWDWLSASSLSDFFPCSPSLLLFLFIVCRYTIRPVLEQPFSSFFVVDTGELQSIALSINRII